MVNRRLDEFQHEFQKSRGETRESSLGGSPIAQKIHDKPVLLNFRLPALETYDDGSDPIEHVIAFQTQIALYDTYDALMSGRRKDSKRPRMELARGATSGSSAAQPRRRLDQPEHLLLRPPPLPLNTSRTEIFL